MYWSCDDQAVLSLMSIETLRNQVIVANRHEGGLKIQPCLAVDPAWFASIQDDVGALLEKREPSDVMKPVHPSYWVRPFGNGATQHNLFNQNGSTSEYANPGAQDARYTFAAPELESLKRFFDPFESRVLTFRLNGLMPGSGLGAHEESIVSGDRIRLRFHLPIFTNPEAALLVDDEKFHFREGYVYFFNNGCVHSAVNQGKSNRYHLVWDMWLDEWIHENLLNLDSPATPCPQLRKLTSGEVTELNRGEKCSLDEYIIGTPTGELILARKRKAPDGTMKVWKTRLHQGADILVENTPLALGDGWYPLETYCGETFRWVNNDAVFTVAADNDGSELLSLELEPGPSMDGKPFVLQVLDCYDCEIKTAEFCGRQRLELTLPVHTGPLNTFRLRVKGGGAAVPGDPRILNFRVFQINSDS